MLRYTTVFGMIIFKFIRFNVMSLKKEDEVEVHLSSILL